MQKGDHCGRNLISPDDVPMPFAELAPDGRVLSCNRALLALAGYDGADCNSLPPLLDLVPPEWRPGEVKAGQHPGEIHFSGKLPAKDGTYIIVEAFVRRVDDDRGLPCRFRASVLDTATIWTLESGLVHAEQQKTIASLVLDELTSPIFATDDRSRIVYANNAAAGLFGKQAYDLQGMNLWDEYPVSVNDLFYRIYQRAFQERRMYSCDHYSTKLNMWYEARFYPWGGGGGGGIIVTLNDITARKHYERFVGLAAYTVNKLSDYVFWLSENGKIIRANDVATKHLHFPERTRVRVSIADVSRITPEAWKDIWTEAKDQGSMTFDTALTGRDGRDIPAEASANFVVYAGQEYCILIARDVSARLAADLAIKRSQEQAELYLDLMSHDINNMNQIGGGFLEMILDDPRTGADVKSLLEKPLEAFRRSSELIASVKKLQKASGTLSMEQIDLADMLRDVVAHYENVQERDVSTRLQADEGCHVQANPLLKEVFANLVGNAIKHSAGRLNIRITLKKIIVADRPCCEVTIEDDGPGISDDAKEKLFNAKLLKEKGGRHRGLGLILVKTLLDDFGGTIRVEDRVPGDRTQGTRFVVTLPAAERNT